jgi:hypothetical protein
MTCLIYERLCIWGKKIAYSVQKFNMRNMHFDTPTDTLWILKCCTEYEFELQMQSHKSCKFHFFLFFVSWGYDQWSCNKNSMWALEILLICAQYRTENSSQNFNRNPICPILLRSKKFAVLYFCHLLKQTKKFQVSYFFSYKIRRDIIYCSNKQANKEMKLFVLINYERQKNVFFFK